MDFMRSFQVWHDFTADRNEYLREALESMGLDSNITLWAFEWSGQIDHTENRVADLRSHLELAHTAAVNDHKKLIVVSHSWGTVLSRLALGMETTKTNPIICDLFVTLGSPLGTGNAFDSLSASQKILYRLANGWQLFLPGNDENLVIDTVALWETYRLPTAVPIVGRWLNYWAWGDVISGPLSQAENFRVDGDQPFRDAVSTLIWHKYDSLQPGGLPGQPNNQPLINRIECEINRSLGIGTSLCYSGANGSW
jgi:pimeloyl-ACP methyl ester carboxylesterase